jgi:hypothetical protein
MAGDAPLRRRRVDGRVGGWTVYRAEIATSDGIDRSHKATGASTAISIALSDHDHPAGLFIGFRTRLSVTLPFSVEAQFDPSTAREGLIDNAWNKWLIGRCGDILAAIVISLLRTNPAEAWGFVAVLGESVGVAGERWPRENFDRALERTRREVASAAQLLLESGPAGLAEIAYESVALEQLLTEADVRQLSSGRSPLPASARDADGRWRKVLDVLGVSTVVGTGDLVEGFRAAAFAEKNIGWWIEAAARLTAHHDAEELFGVPCWLTSEGVPVACVVKGSTARPLLIGDLLSDFARRWNLLQRLHARYSETDSGVQALAWLQLHAAVSKDVDAADELEAFAEAFCETPITIEDRDLRLIRDHFDLLTDRRAEPLGLKVGAALLLEGFAFRGGKKIELKVAPAAAYLSRTLDKDHPYWPDAAGTLPGIAWLASSYEERLKTSATRTSRKRADGTISRGARRFLLLLGAASAPRVVQTGLEFWGGSRRVQQLSALGAEFVDHDFTCPDLDRVIGSLERASKKDRKVRGTALIKALSRYWDTYAPSLSAPAYHNAKKYRYFRGTVDAAWLNRLHESRWVVVGTGELSIPSQAVVRTSQTLALYSAKDFIQGVAAEEIRPTFAEALKLIVDVRASDLVGHLEELRDAPDGFDPSRVQAVYRSLAKLCSTSGPAISRVGDLTVAQLRQRFTVDPGLVWVPAATGLSGRWRRPNELFVGTDIFHDPNRFVPGGPSCAPLWNALGVQRPRLDDCIPVLRELGSKPYSVGLEAILIDVYRHMEPLVHRADRRQRERLRSLPVGTAGGWSSARPVFHVEDRELRLELATSRPDLNFWLPPCDSFALPNVTTALGLAVCTPTITVQPDETAAEQGEAERERFQRCVDHLSNELARNDPATRDRLEVPWSELRNLSLSVHAEPFVVLVSDPHLSKDPVRVRMRAVMQINPLRLDVTEAALPQRESCGRAIASLFREDARRRVEAEWVASWVASADVATEMMQMASDEELAKALQDSAAALSLQSGGKIKVTPPASRAGSKLKPRRLKRVYGEIGAVVIVEGSPPKPAGQPANPLADTEPAPSPSTSTSGRAAPIEYDNRDLEQRGWEVLQQVLSSSDTAVLTDFRKRHHVGADGVIDWKTFVELKATGRGPQSAIEMSASEFERAKERGLDFILALVSGLEEGERTEVRLILDPANRCTVRPVGAVRLVGLADAPGVFVPVSDPDSH